MIFRFWSVICLVSTVHYTSSVRDTRHYNKGPCGPYGFRCINDKVFEICGELKRSNDFSYTDNEELNPPIGSRARCTEDRECDSENPLYCTLLGHRSTRKQNKHKKCNEQTPPPPPTYENEEPDEGDYEDANMDETEEQTECPCPQETTCSSHTTEVVFEESKSKVGKGSGESAGMDLNPQGGAGTTSGPYEVFSKPCKPTAKPRCENKHQNEPPVVFDESKGQGSSCDQNIDKALGGVSSNLYEVYPQDNSTQDVPCEDQGPYSNLFPGDIPDMTSHPPKEFVSSNSNGFACTRAGNYPDPKDCTRYYFCDVNANGDGFVASRRSCRCGEVFNTALRECIPIENLHADARRCSEHKFKCVHCGNFPDPKDCTKYFHCEIDDESCGNFKMSHRKCPHGKKFDKHFKKCVCTHSSEEDDEEEDVVQTRGERGCGGGCPRGEVTCPSPRPPCGHPGCSVTLTPPTPKPCDKDAGLSDIASMNLGEPAGDEYDDSDDDTCCQDSDKVHRFTCRQGGKFADPLNSTTFNLCHPKRADKGFYKIKMNCPTGEVFDEEKQRCIFKHGR